ncbi:hypothetical protein E8E12_002984 [Didymella heteroderae]|uniref:Uncharacterized protein n=1 Tax=Didymella heteroderae TaxID=1769908 RepID=A0A9P5BWB8_9PLEO|nr:hypothetical protein E8E12_002984 [Didymella heteroderae]
MEHFTTSLQDNDIELEPSADIQPEDDDFQGLRELFEQNAGLITPRCCDTIDSILSKYEAVRNEVEQDPRIGIVLSAEFDTTPIQKSLFALSIEQVDRTLHEEPSALLEHCGMRDFRRFQPDVARDSMVDYAEYLLRAATQHQTAVEVGSTEVLRL